MATQAQILANQRNALHSTGPRSVEGKAVARFNALKTGVQAKSQVIPGEDPADLEQLAADYHLQFQPATPLERFLVDTAVTAEWQLRRLRTVEARLWEQSPTPESPDLGQAYDRHLQAFTRLHRRLEAVERSYYRALQHLHRLQIDSGDTRECTAPDPRLPAHDPLPPAFELASFSPMIQPVQQPRRFDGNPALRL